MEPTARTGKGGVAIMSLDAVAGRPATGRRRPTKVDRMEDLLPEQMQYRDLGCEVSPACLECPLPVCRYEVRGGLPALQRRPRDAELLDAYRKGAGIDLLCRQFSLSRRSVFRILAAARDNKQQ